MQQISRQEREAQLLLATLEQRTQIVVQGMEALTNMQEAIQGLLQSLGVQVVIDPSTPPQLQDILLGAGMGAANGMVVGAKVGLLFGALGGKPREGLLLGAILGAVLGGAAGASATQRGVRIRAGYIGSTPWIEATLEAA